jgi:uncharacterized membrane protein
LKLQRKRNAGKDEARDVSVQDLHSIIMGGMGMALAMTTMIIQVMIIALVMQVQMQGEGAGNSTISSHASIN